MPKRRIFYKSSYYHIYGRGVNKMPIFRDMKDYRRFSQRLSTYKKQTGDRLIQYCLMPNHYHFILRAKSSNSIPKLMGRLLLAYSRYHNTKYYRSGHVFEGRYKSINIDTTRYLIWVSRYIHRNPLELDGINTYNLIEYPWSSLAKFCRKRGRSPVKILPYDVLKYFRNESEYLEFVLSDDRIAQRWVSELGMRNGL